MASVPNTVQAAIRLSMSLLANLTAKNVLSGEDFQLIVEASNQKIPGSDQAALLQDIYRAMQIEKEISYKLADKMNSGGALTPDDPRLIAYGVSRARVEALGEVISTLQNQPAT